MSPLRRSYVCSAEGQVLQGFFKNRSSVLLYWRVGVYPIVAQFKLPANGTHLECLQGLLGVVSRVHSKNQQPANNWTLVLQLARQTPSCQRIEHRKCSSKLRPLNVCVCVSACKIHILSQSVLLKYQIRLGLHITIM